MTEPPQLTPATVDDIEDALAYGLRFNGRKRTYTGDEFMARITAKHLVDYLTLCGFVVMKKPPLKPHTTQGGPQQ